MIATVEQAMLVVRTALGDGERGQNLGNACELITQATMSFVQLISVSDELHDVAYELSIHNHPEWARVVRKAASELDKKIAEIERTNEAEQLRQGFGH